MRASFRTGMIRRMRDDRGQSVVEFSLILPFFLGILFTIFTFILLMILSQMTFFTTFMAARSAAVHANAAQEAEELMPRFSLVETDEETTLTMRGRHQMMPYLTGGGGALANPLRAHLTLESRVTLHRWPTCTGAGDNAIPCP